MKATARIEIQHPGCPAVGIASSGRHGRFLPRAVRVFALALLLPCVAGAWVINVQYGPSHNENGGYANAPMGGLTGPSPDTGTTWNSFLGNLNNGRAYNGAQATDAALVDSTGKPTPVKLTFLVPEGYAKPGSNTESLPVFRSCVYVNAPTLSNFVLSGLSPGTLYDLYAISGGSPTNTSTGTFHVTGATVSASQSSANTGPFNAFNSSNTLLFQNLAPTADGKLTLTMEGGTYPTSNGFQLVSQGSSNTYTTWADIHGVTGGSNGDSDNDGIPNLVEYALALNPGASDGSAGTLTGHLLSFNKRSEAVANGDVTYTIETSTNLRDSSTPGDGGWTPVTPDTNNGSIISYTLPSADKIFARLRVRTIP